MTRAERHLWDVLAVLDFDPQVTVSGQTKNGGRWDYILDFAWPIIVRRFWRSKSMDLRTTSARDGIGGARSGCAPSTALR